jgi:hypothetical protein
MRALWLLLSAVTLGLAGGYAWSTMARTGAEASRPPRAGSIALPPSPEEQPAMLDRDWAARADDQAATVAGGNGRADDSVYYPGCNAVRAAGKAPLYSGDPGYREGMDGDRDGIACEPIRGR